MEAVAGTVRAQLGGLRPGVGAAWGSFLRAHTELTVRMNDELEAAHRVPLSTYDVLRQVALAGGRVRMAELADRVMLTRPGLTGVVNRLAAAGYLRRERSESDGRGFYAVLTEGGEACLLTAHKTHVRSIHEHFGDRYTDEDLETLAGLLRRLLPPQEHCQRPAMPA